MSYGEAVKWFCPILSKSEVFMLRRSCLFAFCACVFSVLLFAAGASEAESKKYVVIDRIALIYNDTNAVLPTPKGGWKILPEDMDGIVYGEVVE